MYDLSCNFSIAISFVENLSRVYKFGQ